MSNQTFGKIGEDAASAFLKKLGYKIVTRNFRTRFGEVDIIAKDDEQFVFVEVKTRKDDAYGAPEEAVTKTKQRHLLAAAQLYLQKIRRVNDPWRVDVVALVGANGDFKIKHLKNAVIA